MILISIFFEIDNANLEQPEKSEAAHFVKNNTAAPAHPPGPGRPGGMRGVAAGSAPRRDLVRQTGRRSRPTRRRRRRRAGSGASPLSRADPASPPAGISYIDTAKQRRAGRAGSGQAGPDWIGALPPASSSIIAVKEQPLTSSASRPPIQTVTQVATKSGAKAHCHPCKVQLRAGWVVPGRARMEQDGL